MFNESNMLNESMIERSGGKNMVESVWDCVLDVFKHDEFMVTVVGSNAVLFLSFWLFCVLFTIADVTGWPKWMSRYKVQPGQNEPVEMDKLLGVIKTVLFNQLFLDVPISIILFPIGQYFGYGWKTADIPSIWGFVMITILFTITQEAAFYYSHRALHQGELYRMIHKKHHEWTAPVSIVAHYCHPIEHFLVNSFPMFLGPVLVGGHVMCSWMIYVSAMFITTHHHSGFHLPFAPSPEFHDYHHMTFNYNFGGLGFLDRLHGTDRQYSGSQYEKRHRTLFSLKPIRYFFPDAVKKDQEKTK